MTVRGRIVMISCLVAVFFGQTWLVYSDPAGKQTPALSDTAQEGWRLWHRHNCQACHQRYGFGGFLGPDLTNVAPSLTKARLESVLTVGAGQMPAFHLDAGQRQAIFQFLIELDQTGVGQLRLEEPQPARDLLDEAVEAILAKEVDEVIEATLAKEVDEVIEATLAKEETLPPLTAIGREIVYRENCIGCHLPNPASTHGATDMTTLTTKLGGSGALAIITAGIPSKGMPRISLDGQEQSALVAFLTWLADHADDVRAAFPKTSSTGEGWLLNLPWFEYE